MKEHEVKILPEHYRNVASGLKTFESRKDDRGYAAGDILLMREFNGTMYTGRIIRCLITDVYREEFAKDGYCILSIRLLFPESEPRLPMSVYIELFQLFSHLREKCDDLKEPV